RLPVRATELGRAHPGHCFGQLPGAGDAADGRDRPGRDRPVPDLACVARPPPPRHPGHTAAVTGHRPAFRHMSASALLVLGICLSLQDTPPQAAVFVPGEHFSLAWTLSIE